jgi:ribonuclease III
MASPTIKLRRGRREIYMFLETLEEKFLLSAFATSKQIKITNHSSIKYLSTQLSYDFKNIEILQTALQHKSFCHEFPELALSESNERLEFLGDAVLDLAVAHALFLKFPNEDEGILSKARSSVVNEDILSKLALYCGVDNCILIGKGEFKNQGFNKKSILSDAMEAIICGVFLDSTYDQAVSVVNSLFSEYQLANKVELFTIENIQNFDAKTKLQNQCMKEFGSLPEYRSTTTGESQFEVSLIINKEEIAKLSGNNKKNLKKKLAQIALTKKSIFNKGGANALN